MDIRSSRRASPITRSRRPRAPIRASIRCATLPISPISAARPTSSSSILRSLPELVARAREKSLDFVSPGVGTLGHLLVEEFAREAGVKLQHIPHKGSAQAMLDLLAGNVPFGSMTWSSALGQIRAGKVIPLAVSSKARVAGYPDVPTLAELGYADLVANTWYALSGPAGVPGEIVVKLNHAVADVLALPDVNKRLDEDAIEREPMTPEQVTAFIGREVAKWGPVARKFVPSP